MTEFVPDGEAVGEGVEPMFVPQGVGPSGGNTLPGVTAERLAELEALVSERTDDLQRLGAEYVNYKKRVDRDRTVARTSGAESVLVELLPVLDAIGFARAHDELNGGFKLVADELEKVTTKHGLVPFGAKGDPFDPRLHDALMHMPMPGVLVTTCSEVMQLGYLLGDRVLRPARVAVAEPDSRDAAASDTVN